MPSEPQEKTFVATHKLKFTIPDRHGPLTPASRVSTSQPVPSNGGTHSSQSKAGSGTTPLDGSTPLDLKGRLKNWRRNMMQPANQSLQAILSLNRSRYQSVMIFIPENEDYPIYNLDAKLGDRDGYNSIEFRCSASSDGVSSFREITLEIGLFHLDPARTPIQVIRFYPEGPQSKQTELLDPNSVTFGGENFKNDSKTTWTWKANDVLADGLEDALEFWVTIPPAEKGVKAVFKLTSRVRTSASSGESYELESSS